MEQFCKTIELIKNEFAQKQDTLYNICNNDLQPWDNERHLTVKLRIISMECGNPLYEGFTRFDKDKKPIESYSFKGNVDDLYLFVSRYLINNAEKLSDTLSARISFVGSMDEITGVLSDSVGYVLKLANLLTEAVQEYNLRFVEGFDPSSTLPPFIKLSSAILHYHFPYFAFLYQRYTSRYGKLFLGGKKCVINGVVVPDKVKDDLSTIFILAANHLRNKYIPQYNPHTTFWTLDYVNYCAHAYALGCFVTKHFAIDDGTYVSGLVNEIFDKIK